MDPTALHNLLRSEAIRRSTDKPSITSELVNNLVKKFLPDGTHNCKKMNCQIKNCQSRCGSHYWKDHGRTTQQLMELLARKIGEDEIVYGRVGFIHDLDYLQFPHDRASNKNAHPIPLVNQLIEDNIHPEISLAILEHAPYLKLTNDNRSKLSYSLTACEELATLLSTKNNAKYYSSLSNEAKELAESINEPPLFLIDLNIDVMPRVINFPQKYINTPLSAALKINS